MDYIPQLLLVGAIAYLIYSGNKSRIIAASEGDWYVVFDIDAEKKVLCLWFYPIIGFRLLDEQTIAITSRPAVTTKLASSRPAKMVGEGLWAVSISYGRWLRNGAPFDETGSPDIQDNSDFSSTVTNYLLGDFKIHTNTPVPVFYQNQIENAVARAKQP